MEVAIMTCLPTKWDMDINASQCFFVLFLSLNMRFLSKLSKFLDGKIAFFQELEVTLTNLI
jgi:hypothetical protein